MNGAVDPFEIRRLLPDYEAHMAGYQVASEGTRRSLRNQLDIGYGDHPRERLDLFFPAAPSGRPAPVHLFVHGGYWRAHVKETYAFVADAVTQAGAIAVIVEYPLMPGLRMATLVSSVRRAAVWVRNHAAAFG